MASCSDGPSSSGAGTATKSELLDTYDCSPPNECETLKVDHEVLEAVDHEDPMNCFKDQCHLKPPTPCPPVVDLRGREVIFAIAVFFLFSVSVGLIVILATTKLSENKCPHGKPVSVRGSGDSGEVCVTKDCLMRAAYMLDTMDPTADPCTDFWQYSCGGWYAKTTIPAQQDSWSVDHEINRKIKEDLRRKVESPVTKDTRDSIDRKVKVLYRKCMDVESIDEDGYAPLKGKMDELGGWAVLPDWNLGKKSGLWNFQEALAALHFTYWRDSFFSVWVAADHKNSDTNVIQMDQSGLGLESRDLYFDESDPGVIAYKAYMGTVVRLFGVSERDAKHFVETNFNFEKELARIMVPIEHESRRNPDAMYNPITIQELEDIAPRINWLHFFRNNFDNVTWSTVVVVTDKAYMTNMSNLIQNSDARTLNYYLMWRLVSYFARVLSKPFREAAAQFDSSGKEMSSIERWKTCLEFVDDTVGMAMGRLFITDNFPKSSREEVVNIIQHVQRKFKQRLRAIKWMDNETRRQAIDKVTRMVYRIGYPDFLLNESKVEEFYKNLEVNESDTYLQLNFNSIRYEVNKMAEKLKRPPSTDEWEMTPHAVNAYYAAIENKMVFPAGILQVPYYSRGVPNYVNYGSIGSTVGHEMIHGFDNFGAMYDADGNLNSWWSESSWENFQDRTKCTSQHYSSLTIEGLNINGDLTLGENIADIGGITQAFKAYLELEEDKGEEPELPGLGLSNHQVFFLAYGQNWCIKQTKENLVNIVRTNAHAPAQIRVNGSLSQIPYFSEAFSCKKTNPMYAIKPCSVW